MRISPGRLSLFQGRSCAVEPFYLPFSLSVQQILEKELLSKETQCALLLLTYSCYWHLQETTPIKLAT
jgi:hypothetical protein